MVYMQLVARGARASSTDAVGARGSGLASLRSFDRYPQRGAYRPCAWLTRSRYANSMSKCPDASTAAVEPTRAMSNRSGSTLVARLAALLVILACGKENVVDLVPGQFDTVFIGSTETEFDLNGFGSNVDGIAFWEASPPQDGLMFVSSKDVELVEVWRYPFRSATDSLPSLTHPCISNGSNGVLVDQDRDVLYVTVRFEPSICVFGLPNLAFQHAIRTAGSSGNSEPNLGLLQLPTGQRHLYVSYDDVVYMHDAVTGAELGRFKPERGLEELAGDAFHQVLYVPDESDKTGIYIYDPVGNLQSSFGGGGVFDSDAEGILVYTCPSDGVTDNGKGFIIVSDQRNPLTDFEFFDRQSKEHLGTVQIEGVNNTDGTGSTQLSSPAYSLGLFTAIDDDESAVGVAWSTILQKTGLTCG